jgi:predicted signal transduction protein with EAL and GGDEF domain
MAHGLGLDVVVEGLETPDLVEMAIGLGADVGQGYAIARPMPAAQLVDWVADWNWQLRPESPATALGMLASQYRNAQKLGLRAAARVVQ